jgi:hypothetical protein
LVSSSSSSSSSSAHGENSVMKKTDNKVTVNQLQINIT